MRLRISRNNHDDKNSVFKIAMPLLAEISPGPPCSMSYSQATSMQEGRADAALQQEIPPPYHTVKYVLAILHSMTQAVHGGQAETHYRISQCRDTSKPGSPFHGEMTDQREEFRIKSTRPRQKREACDRQEKNHPGPEPERPPRPHRLLFNSLPPKESHAPENQPRQPYADKPAQNGTRRQRHKKKLYMPANAHLSFSRKIGTYGLPIDSARRKAHHRHHRHHRHPRHPRHPRRAVAPPPDGVMCCLNHRTCTPPAWNEPLKNGRSHTPFHLSKGGTLRQPPDESDAAMPFEPREAIFPCKKALPFLPPWSPRIPVRALGIQPADAGRRADPPPRTAILPCVTGCGPPCLLSSGCRPGRTLGIEGHVTSSPRKM